MRRHFPLLLLLLALLLAWAAYAPGLSGSFVFDDKINIIDNTRLHVKALDAAALRSATLSGEAGIFGRPVSMLSLALDHWRSGLHAPDFKLTNLLIHLLTGIAVYGFSCLLLQALRRRRPDELDLATARWISVALAAAWLVHPLNLTSVLYVVQRMTSLAALFTLLGLISYLYGRLHSLRAPGRAGWAWVAASFLLFTPLAALSKENGALLPLFLLLTEIVFFRFEAPSPRAKRALQGVFGVTVVLPALALLVYTAVAPGWITNGYEMRTFTLGERLLTETRILWTYVRLAFAPDIAQLGLYHDDFPVSTSLLEPVTTLLSAVGIVLALGVAVAGWRRYPLLAYGILFFALGHVMESTVLALELMHEHRNYLPLVGLLLPLFYYLALPTAHMRHKLARPAIAAGAVALLAGVTFVRAGQWSEPVLMHQMEVNHHPRSIRALISLANLYSASPASDPEQKRALYQAAYGYYTKATELSPDETFGLFGLIDLSARNGLAPDPAWVSELAHRIRNSPMAPSTVNVLVYFEQCFSNKRCNFEAQTIETLLTAALGHPRLQAGKRTELLLAWSNFLWQSRRDEASALKAAYGALAASPANLEAREAVIVFLINMKRDQEARTHIAALRAADRMQVKTAVLAELEGILTARKRSSP